MVNGVQYGNGMMGAGARATEYDSRRLGGRVWESDWDTRNSRLTDDIILPGMQFDRQPSYGNAGLHCDPTHDFTQNAPRWNPVFGNQNLMLETAAIFDGMAEYPPQAHVSIHAPTIYRRSNAYPQWSEAPPSQSARPPFYLLAPPQRFHAGIAQWGKRSARVTAARFIN
jgi:hypothetical protein